MFYETNLVLKLFALMLFGNPPLKVIQKLGSTLQM